MPLEARLSLHRVSAVWREGGGLRSCSGNGAAGGAVAEQGGGSKFLLLSKPISHSEGGNLLFLLWCLIPPEEKSWPRSYITLNYISLSCIKK